MATPAQIAANRRNALRSTGPVSVEGKAISRFNALKTGIQAKSQVIPGEDPVELEQLAADYHLQFQPSTPLERFLVDVLVNAEWQLRRFSRLEAKLWEHALVPDSSGLGEAYDRNLQTFARLHRRMEAIERSYYHALQQLQRLQADSGGESDVDEPPSRAAGPELASFSDLLQSAETPSPSPARASHHEENKALRL